MERWFKSIKSLNVKLLSIYLPLVSVSVLAMFAVLEVGFYRQERANLVESLNSMSDIQRTSLTAAVWEYDIAHVEGVLADMARLPDLQGVAVLDSTNDVLSAFGDIESDPEAPDFKIETTLTYAASGQEESIGTFVAIVHSKRIWQDVWQHMKTNLLVIAVLMITLAGVTFFSSRVVIGRPISALQRSIENISSGAAREDVDWHSADELGQVVNAFNELQGAQEAAEQEVRRYQDDLEALVAERTSELSQTSSKLSLALDNMSDGIFAVDKNLNYSMFNYRYVELLELPESLVKVGSPLEDVVRHLAKRGGYGSDSEDGYVAERLATYRADEVATREVRLPDGRIVEFRNTPIEGGGNVGIASDITERKRHETELMKAMVQAESATRAKSSFLATMSHEIRTPMNGVVGMIDLLRETPMDADQQQMMRTIRDSAFALLHIINDILDFSKIEAGKLELEAIPISIRDVVEGVVETLLPNTVSKGTQVLSFIDPAIPARLMGDPVRVRQILFNIAGNAVKFTEPSDGRRGTVWIRAEYGGEGETENGKPAAKLRLVVQDSGIGMSKKAVDDLFTPFTQAEQSTVRKFGGTGLGLSICKNLTDLMAGNIGVESTEGVGSVFTISIMLPLPTGDNLMAFEPNEPDFSDLKMIVASSPDHHARDVMHNYARHRCAAVTLVDNPASLRAEWASAVEADQPFDVVIVSDDWLDEERETIIRDIRGVSEKHPPRFVLLDARRDTPKGAVLPDTVVLDCEPLRRSQFLRGIAIAVGRESPDVDEHQSEDKRTKKKVLSVEEAATRGELILFAEDNLTNQDVIQRQLNSLGYTCEIADNGREALDALDRRRHAILLTDCHMPEMDGFQLTAGVRQQEIDQELIDRLPIIAITANALQGEADRCIAAGMDDYLSKPVEMAKLRATLKRWMPQSADTHVEHEPPEQAKTSEPASKPEPEAAPEGVNEDSEDESALVVDLTSLKDMFGDDPETISEILQDFIAPSVDIVAEIKAGFDDRDETAVALAAHKLKSSSRAVGANSLADLCLTLEMAGKEGDWVIIDASYPDLEPLMDQVTSCIESM
jgi:signal transduction histidine kinase/CheY-like chemotaxis protein/HPt (histidine-containing phosphotransfer) domain-containing protein/HAMP domain-containing protein